MTTQGPAYTEGVSKSMNEVELPNKLNSAPIESIEANDLIGFCNLRREEGIDLDYKSDWPSDLEKVICSFANTQGGIVLIGVHEEEKTRKPKLPINGIDGEPSSIYQRIMNIASDGIYPPVSPEIKVCELPEHKGKYAILIRILPSKLMHATDHRRKIYVRVGDTVEVMI
jgi:predicted HTH transcriptional regulator